MPFTVYLSSTLKDLEAERAAVRDVLGGDCAVKQSYDASEETLVQSCLNDVAACDLYIGILGLRYGYVPDDGLRNPEKLSITELEYRQAREQGIPRLVFLKDRGAITFDLTDAGTSEHPMHRVLAFRKHVADGAEQRAAQFSTPEGLKVAVVKAVAEFKEKRAKRGADPIKIGRAHV